MVTGFLWKVPISLVFFRNSTATKQKYAQQMLHWDFFLYSVIQPDSGLTVLDSADVNSQKKQYFPYPWNIWRESQPAPE